MKRREFLSMTGMIAAAGVASPVLTSCCDSSKGTVNTKNITKKYQTDVLICGGTGCTSSGSQKIQAAFATLTAGHTSFIVAHRLSTIKGADTILVMNDGKVIEKGNHSELMERGGFYSELYNSQFAEE